MPRGKRVRNINKKTKGRYYKDGSVREFVTKLKKTPEPVGDLPPAKMTTNELWSALKTEVYKFEKLGAQNQATGEAENRIGTLGNVLKRRKANFLNVMQEDLEETLKMIDASEKLNTRENDMLLSTINFQLRVIRTIFGDKFPAAVFSHVQRLEKVRDKLIKI